MKLLEIKFKAILNKEWSSWFNDLEIAHVNSKYTKIRGSIEDFSEFNGLLEKIRNLGLEPDFIKYE